MYNKNVSDPFKTHEMCDKAVDKYLFLFGSVPDQYKTQEMCNKVVQYCRDRYRTQEICNKAVDDFLSALKLVPHCFVTNKIIKKLLTASYADAKIVYFNEDSGNAIFPCNEMDIISVDLNNINLDDTNYGEDDPETIIHIRPLDWYIEFENRKALN